jgi:chromate transport protein ChrA
MGQPARGFLIGFAVIQAFPRLNLHFAVFLGSLTAIDSGYPSINGAIIALCGIFALGIILVHGRTGVWGVLRNQRWVKSAVRGINARPVGLVNTAVYRIWYIGYLDKASNQARVWEMISGEWP